MKFYATSVSAIEDDEIGVITVHFDDEVDLYLQFQGASLGYEEDYYDGGYVYMEIIGQAYGAYDCFSHVELSRDKIKVLKISEKRIKSQAEEIEVNFDITTETYEKVKKLLQKTFRDCKEKLALAEQ